MGYAKISKWFIFVFELIFSKVLEFDHKLILGVIEVRKLIDDIVLFSNFLSVGLLSETIILKIFIEEVRIVTETEQRHCYRDYG